MEVLAVKAYCDVKGVFLPFFISELLLRFLKFIEWRSVAQTRTQHLTNSKHYIMNYARHTEKW